MRLISFPKFVALLLLPAFLIASAGDMLSYAWCLGDDGHVEINYVTSNGCCDSNLETSHIVRPNVSTLHQSSNNHCGSCLDFSAQPNEAVFSKRLKRISSGSIAITSNGFPPISAQDAKLVVGNLASQTPTRISQTILAHRTVVLLN
jgi:hypothetical protein